MKVAPPAPAKDNEEEWTIDPFFVTQAHEAYLKGHLNAGYGSRHDMMTFAFVHPCESSPELTREQILERYEWANPEEINVCDDCIDELMADGELKVISDPLGDLAEAFREYDEAGCDDSD